MGLGTPVVQFTLIFAIQMWTFPQKSDFFQIRNTGNFSVLGKSTFSKSEIPEIFQKIAGNYRQKKTLSGAKGVVPLPLFRPLRAAVRRPVLPRESTLKIGRASWRERV